MPAEDSLHLEFWGLLRGYKFKSSQRAWGGGYCSPCCWSLLLHLLLLLLLDGWMAGLLDGWMAGLLDGWMAGLVDGWMAGLVDCWIAGDWLLVVGLLGCWLKISQ